MINIIQTKPGDESVEFDAIIYNVVTGKTNGAQRSTYLSITLQDQSGSIDAKLWSATDEQVANFVNGVVVKVKGDIIKYNTDKQMKISSIDILSTDPNDQVKYLKQAPISEKEMIDDLVNNVAKIENKIYNDVVRTIYRKYIKEFSKYPAATKNHHEYVSGLIHHTTGMLKIANALCDMHPSINRDLLLSGVMLHDLGKVIELSGPVMPEYTLEGKLLGHISICQAIIKQVGDELGYESEEITLLRHMVLSHHGKYEFGSPVLPMLKEAELLSIIDNLDARIVMLDKALDEVEEGSFTKRVFSLENRSFYKPKKNNI